MESLQLIILGFLIAFFCIVLAMGFGIWFALANTQGGNLPWLIPVWAIPLILILICDVILMFKFGWSKRWYPFLAGQLLCIFMTWGCLLSFHVSL